jgi:DNA-binding MarR family transcriptional regulator
VSAPRIGERYRGVEGRSGYLLRQAWQIFQLAMEAALREHRLTSAQYGVLSVLARDPGMSGADLARAIHTTPQTIHGVLATMERAGLIERRPHPTHGRILQTTLTDAGRAALEASTPAVQALERAVEEGLAPDQLAAIKAWLVASARRMEQAAAELRG